MAPLSTTPAPPSSDPAGPSGRSTTNGHRKSSAAPSSPTTSARRPAPPPSETNAAFSEADVFADDQVLEKADLRRQNPLERVVPRLNDAVGERVAEVFEEFLETFVEDAPPSSQPVSSAPTSDKYYVAQIHSLKEFSLSTLYVDFAHLLSFNEGVLAKATAENYYRFLPFLTRALQNCIARHEPTYFRSHRQAGSSTGTTASVNGASQSQATDGSSTNQPTDKLFSLAFYNLPLISRIRQLRTASVGKLMSISGTVTRTSEVRPELYLGTFVCQACRAVVENVEQVFRYTEPVQCPNLTCQNRFAWTLDLKQSTFVDWQKVRIQENSSEIPTGSMPRTMDVILRGEIVDRAKAGEKCIFTGAVIVVPDVSQLGLPGVRPEASADTRNAPRGGDAGGSGVSGLKTLGVRDLTYRMAFLGCMVVPDLSTTGTQNKIGGEGSNILASLSYMDAGDPYAAGEEAQEAYLQSLTIAEIEDLKKMVHSDHIYARLVNSLAPMVYGHDIVKKGLLLQLMGGVSKVTPEGMNLRGDINICIVGDPSTSKSQFLKYICSFLPRAVYTSGKASSAAGLTAAVIKDEETGEFTIEAGALMLADNGICAIDEFDKMDIADQVAIHEAMEQQTISIAKAGIQATLNARTSILAAANPVGGRYNRKSTLRANVNMSAPIMSRFDLFFIILDECNEQIDTHLARHIVGIHRDRDEAVQPEFSTEQLQRYIRFARTFRPEFTAEAKRMLVERYKELRANDQGADVSRNSYRVTVRQLESLIRLSEAIAKANCVTDVTPAFVREAYNLLRQSIISVEKDDVEFDEDDDGAPGALAQDVMDDAEAQADQQQELRDAAMRDAAAADDDGGQNGAGARRKTKITHEDWTRMVNTLAKRVHQSEEESGHGVEETELVTWYLEQREDDIDSEQALADERALCKKVLKRMCKEGIFLPVRGEGEGLLPDGQDQAEALGAERCVYIMHPNCAVEEW